MSTQAPRTASLRGAQRVALLVFLAGGGAGTRTAHADLSPQAAEPSTAVSETAAPPRDLQTAFAIDDVDPERAVPTHEQAMKKPLEMGYWLMLVTERAEAASKRGDHALAAKYFRALGRAVPDRSVAFAKACVEHELAGDVANAIASCKAALAKPGATLDDSLRFLRLMLAGSERLQPAEVADIEAVIEHLRVELPKQDGSGTAQENALLVAELQCELALRLEDRARLDACAGTLGTLAPNDPRTLSFGFSSALLGRDLERARQLLEHGRRVGMSEQALSVLSTRLELEQERSAPWTALRSEPWTWSAVAVGVLSALVLLARALRRRTRDQAAA